MLGSNKIVVICMSFFFSQQKNNVRYVFCVTENLPSACSHPQTSKPPWKGGWRGTERRDSSFVAIVPKVSLLLG